MNKDKLELEIKDKNLTAPRITPEHVESIINSVNYFTGREGVLGAYKSNNDIYQGDSPNAISNEALSCITFCVIILDNGYTVVGQSACTSPSNYNKELGESIALSKAKDKVFELEGYLLKCKLGEIV